ncbi:GNAT family N-acetyltransferase [Paenibacillus pasadenensis]|uniref:GNAT family N-acetyltransferase n=1 Tax=Paenibacillus pasadenensis TaxID=217090 RepID=UPI00203B9420|nr:GNAT family N-acetyltransferase [Paenibacillus pasadenensis]MCM3745830.1 GNAT family N-acetyltransferase [Paenibacillus pasadenensis]
MYQLERLSITDPIVSQELRDLQTVAYKVEAYLIGFHGIPHIGQSHEALLASPADFYGCRLQGRLAGAIALEQESPGEITIDRLVVHPDFFRKGIGRFMLLKALEMNPNADHLVSTGTLNAPAIQLYTAAGFTETSRLEVAPGVELTFFKRPADLPPPNGQ